MASLLSIKRISFYHGKKQFIYTSTAIKRKLILFGILVMPWSTHVTIMTKLSKIVSLHRKNIKIKILAFYNGIEVRTFKFNDVLNWIVFQLTPLNTWGTARLSPIKSSSNGDRSCNRCNQNKRPKTWVLISSMKWGNVTIGQSLNSLPFESIFFGSLLCTYIASKH